VPPVALTIAGSDPSGGAGIQADLKTFHQFGVYGEAVLTVVTVQNTIGIEKVERLLPELVIAQLQAVLSDIPPQAAKTGALGSREMVEALSELAGGFNFPLVVDPVMISKHGAPLLSGDAVEAVKTHLARRAFLLTPNLAEASALSGIEVRSISDMREAAVRISDLGSRAVLVKGGHLPGSATDVLYWGGNWQEFPAAHIETRHTHGTGCTYSAAITAELARGTRLNEAVARAKAYIGEAIRTSPGLGRGAGPVNHHASIGGKPVQRAMLRT
jgi:hydroxymethylpyrimidine/phosphomethylpyrimidine kinase